MENMNLTGDNGQDGMSQHAVSLYGANEGVDDFPVLKAFQQYIDAEQEKARKRIIGLGIFFGAILVIVVAVFMILLHGINTRNQALSDRLVEYAMKEADRRQQSALPAPVRPDESAMKAMTETLVAIQKKMESSSEKDADKVQSENAARDLAAQQESLRLQRLQNQLEAEKKLLSEERERLHQIEIDRQRRKLYPELYENAAAQRATTPSRTRTLTDDDIREIIREAYSESEMDEARPSPSDKKGMRKQQSGKAEAEIELEDDGAIEYFKDDDYTIPVDVRGSDSKVHFTVPIGG